jgi:hypothetical protein
MFLAYILEGVSQRVPLNPIARWEWVFPIVEAVHICGFTLLVGSIVILDLRLLGIRLVSQPVSRLAKELSGWIWAGIILQLTTGPYLFSGDPREYVQIAAFRNKMLFLLLALVFHFTVIRRATAPSADSSPLGWRRPAALLSLGLWFCVVLAGLWIGNL